MLYDLVEKEIIRTFTKDHPRGVRKLAYTPEYGGNLVSLGHEIYATVWGPEAKVEEVILGRLKGHTKPLIDVNFLGITPFCVTMDDGGNIRVWDIKSLSCL